jgi:hypothetical protein
MNQCRVRKAERGLPNDEERKELLGSDAARNSRGIVTSPVNRIVSALAVRFQSKLCIWPIAEYYATALSQAER